jgi:hypothetical protein
LIGLAAEDLRRRSGDRARRPAGRVAARFSSSIANRANLLNLNPFWQRIVTGALIMSISPRCGEGGAERRS